MTKKSTGEAENGAGEAPVKAGDASASQPVADQKAEWDRLLSAVSKNPAQVEFPRDEWGMTSELRKVGLRTAAGIRGNDAKLQLFLQTLAILGRHAQARINDDKAELERRLAEREKIARNDRVFARNVPAPVTEAAIPLK